MNDKSDQLSGLPVAGYQPQSAHAVETVNLFKAQEEYLLRRLDALKDHPTLKPDPRWLATGRTHIEQGFMAINRSIFKPGRVDIDVQEDGETAWLLERADSSPSEPLYFCAGDSETAWSKDHQSAMRFARKKDAQAFALWIGTDAECGVRIAEHQWG